MRARMWGGLPRCPPGWPVPRRARRATGGPHASSAQMAGKTPSAKTRGVRAMSALDKFARLLLAAGGSSCFAASSTRRPHRPGCQASRHARHGRRSARSLPLIPRRRLHRRGHRCLHRHRLRHRHRRRRRSSSLLQRRGATMPARKTSIRSDTTPSYGRRRRTSAALIRTPTTTASTRSHGDMGRRGLRRIARPHAATRAASMVSATRGYGAASRCASRQTSGAPGPACARRVKSRSPECAAAYCDTRGRARAQEPLIRRVLAEEERRPGQTDGQHARWVHAALPQAPSHRAADGAVDLWGGEATSRPAGD